MLTSHWENFSRSNGKHSTNHLRQERTSCGPCQDYHSHRPLTALLAKWKICRSPGRNAGWWARALFTETLRRRTRNRFFFRWDLRKHVDAIRLKQGGGRERSRARVRSMYLHVSFVVISHGLINLTFPSTFCLRSKASQTTQLQKAQEINKSAFAASACQERIQ